MYYDNSQIELKRSQLNPSQCRHFHTVMSVYWRGMAIDAHKLPLNLTDIRQYNYPDTLNRTNGS